MKVTLDHVIRRDKESSKGKSYVQVSVKIKDQWYTAFAGKWNEDWADGSVIELDTAQITENDYNGKTYYNIKAPAGASKQWNNGSSKVEEKLDAIISMLTTILDCVQGPKAVIKDEAPEDYDPLAEDLPF